MKEDTKECKDCHKILQELEKIDDDAENFGVQFVKNGEKFLAKKYGVSEFPSLVYFRNKHPAIYDGDLMKEDAVLAWLTNIESMELPDAIEEVNAKVLESLIDETEYVAVLFCEYPLLHSKRSILVPRLGWETSLFPLSRALSPAKNHGGETGKKSIVELRTPNGT
ncbi:hypothetical protein AVEN_16843-1 [Araneus ventricosus]|uniref:Thioredoxin domain-containing protein n=2 Tax=Araneus ventricosus TaxID=182803 RepID=A0A4Y2VTJ6_ARAVE|nr:hypothetical protein AVEN_1860-1 [Araneus ventricosus]GBO28218.1 hypothetical protein AVEN_16843-1 [Araneus ventricosus]